MLDPQVEDPVVVRISIGFFTFTFVIAAWLAYDTLGAVRVLFFYMRDIRLSPRMIRFLRIEAAFIAVGSLYLVFSYLLKI
jgi:hypothetical protein